jgi:hypothetical protein
MYLVVLKTMAIAKLSSKPILLHPSNPLMGNICLNNTGTIIYFYFLLYQAEEGRKPSNVQQVLILEFVYIYLRIASTQVRLKNL